MGIMPYNYGQYGPNSIYDSNYELRRQLETRQSQLDTLNKREVLSDDQLKRRNDLEKTVSMLQSKLDKQLGKSSAAGNGLGSNKPSIENISLYEDATGNSQSTGTSVKPVSTKAAYTKVYSEGSVTAKSPATQGIYTQASAKSQADNSFLKGFFFDARI